MNRGRLLAFEGLDGSGKSTQAARLARALQRAGADALLTREPGDGPAGRRIRAMLHSGQRVSPEQELAWFFEDRRDHVARVMEPPLAAGRSVVTDRYTLSTVAYQGARGLDAREILARSEAEFPLPELVLLLEIDPGRGLDRVHARASGVETVFEREDFLARVAAILRGIDRDYVERIDASAPEDEVAREVEARVRGRLSLL